MSVKASLVVLAVATAACGDDGGAATIDAKMADATPAKVVEIG